MPAEHSELKHLQRRIDEARASMKALKENKKTLEDKIKLEQSTIDKLTAEIDKLKKKSNKIVVSEHALLRYFERVMKFDLEEIKKKVLPETLDAPVKTLGSGTYPTETHKVRIKDGVVVTILTDE